MIKFNTIEMTARAEDYVRDRAMTAHQLVTFAVREIILAVHPDEPTQQERPMYGDQDEVDEVAYVDILCGGLWEECRGRNAKAMADVLAKRGYAIVRVPRKVDPIDRPFTHEPEQDGAAKYNEAKPDIDHFGAEIKAPRSIPRQPIDHFACGAVDSKYGRVLTESGKIPAGEPVVVFRAQDKFLPAVLHNYLSLCAAASASPIHQTMILTVISKILVWQHDHKTKVPD